MSRAVSLAARAGRRAAAAARTLCSSRSGSRAVMLHSSPNPWSSLSRSLRGRRRASQTMERASACPADPARLEGVCEVGHGAQGLGGGGQHAPVGTGQARFEPEQLLERQPSRAFRRPAPLHLTGQLNGGGLGGIQRGQGGGQRGELAASGTAVRGGQVHQPLRGLVLLPCSVPHILWRTCLVAGVVAPGTLTGQRPPSRRAAGEPDPAGGVRLTVGAGVEGLGANVCSRYRGAQGLISKCVDTEARAAASADHRRPAGAIALTVVS